MTNPYVLIVVRGGMADLGFMTGEADYDILDLDNIMMALADSFVIELSEGERTWIASNDPTLLARINEHNVKYPEGD